MPAQPPFLTPTRKPAIGFSEPAMISVTRAAAASVRVKTLNRDLEGIVFSLARVQGPARRQQYNNGCVGLTGRHVAPRHGGKIQMERAERRVKRRLLARHAEVGPRGTSIGTRRRYAS